MQAEKEIHNYSFTIPAKVIIGTIDASIKLPKQSLIIK